jgi:phosphoenolpyruvate-protein phosphotransferase
MTEHLLRGLAASPGLGVGAARLLDAGAGAVADVLPPAEREAEADRAALALADAAVEVDAVAESLRQGGRVEEAQIVETGALMARDPALVAAARRAVLERGHTAARALAEAADVHADAIAALPDPMLAARADDVRSLGRRAARLTGDTPSDAPPGRAGDVVLVARDLGPADVAELGPDVRAVALAAGGVTAHAAIVARSLGIPMVAGAGSHLFAVSDGDALVVDGDSGSVVLDPSAQRIRDAREATRARDAARERALAVAGLEAVTRDGHRVDVLANVATATEVDMALAGGADGVGLLRTELGFLEAAAWPSEEEHRRALAPVLAGLAGRVATVRVLDFGADKTPPFLRGARARGVGLLLEAPEAFAAQLRAIVDAGRATELRVLLPMVSSPVELRAARDLLETAVAAVPGATMPALGAMVETPRAAAAAYQLALRADFLSIGTNDLTASTLQRDRFAPGEATPYHPRVLSLVERTIRAAKEAGVPVEVCGEAASDSRMLPLLVGFGTDEVSIAAARVPTVRAWVRALELAQVRELARQALTAGDAAAVARLMEPVARRLDLDERGDARGERLNGDGGVVAVGPHA